MLEELKKEVLHISVTAEDKGLCQHGAGNFSMIDRKNNLVAITPHAESRHKLKDSDILIVDLDGNVVESLGNLTPSSETLIHLEVLKSRPEINAVCHTHARNACVFAVLNREIKPVLLESAMFGGICRVAPFQMPGSMELARSVVEGLEGTEAVILQQHGLLTIGATIYDAYLKSIYVEEVADVYLRAASIVGYDNVEYISSERLEYLMVKMGVKA